MNRGNGDGDNNEDGTTRNKAERQRGRDGIDSETMMKLGASPDSSSGGGNEKPHGCAGKGEEETRPLIL